MYIYMSEKITNINYKIPNNTSLYNTLDKISGGRNRIIAFDLEFQTYQISKKDMNKYNFCNSGKKSQKVFFGREFGMVLFDKKNNNWYCSKNLFFHYELIPYKKLGWDRKLSFPPYLTLNIDSIEGTNNIIKENIQYIKKRYKIGNKTLKIIKKLVKNNTNNKLEQQLFYMGLGLEFNDKKTEILQNIFNKIIDKDKQKRFQYITSFMHSIYRRHVKKNSKNIFDNIFNIYEDATKETRISNDRAIGLLREHFIEDCAIVYKGGCDNIAFQNHCKYLSMKQDCIVDFSKLHHVDIAVYNWLSYMLFGNAKLEKTYEGLLERVKNKDINTFHKYYIKQNNGLSAHDPTSDAYFTIIVALFMNLDIISDLDIIQKEIYKKLKECNDCNMKICIGILQKVYQIMNINNNTNIKNTIIKNIKKNKKNKESNELLLDIINNLQILNGGKINKYYHKYMKYKSKIY